MATGLLAAQALLRQRREGLDDAATRAAYADAQNALVPRFAMYERANRVNERPRLADLAIWRARRTPALVRRMAGVLDETADPGRLVSLRGVAKLFLPMR